MMHPAYKQRTLLEGTTLAIMVRLLKILFASVTTMLTLISMYGIALMQTRSGNCRSARGMPSWGILVEFWTLFSAGGNCPASCAGILDCPLLHPSTMVAGLPIGTSRP